MTIPSNSASRPGTDGLSINDVVHHGGDGHPPQSATGGLELLVASGGGHLHELRLLRERFEPAMPRAHWVTYGTPDAERRVAGEPMTVCHYPTSRSLPNAGRNLVLARQLLRTLRPRRVISTGAGVAVPFLHAATALGIEAHYIESAARVDGPSLSGRLLKPSTPASLFTQHGSWADDRWTYAGDVFEGFEVVDTGASVRDRPLRVVVSVGTQSFGFPRLVDAVARVTGVRDEVFAQLGATTSAPDHWETASMVPPDELEARFRTADVVVCHAGVGLMLNALEAGKIPIVIPRRKAEGEHVDDHQRQIAGSLARRGLARMIRPEQARRVLLLDQLTRRVVRASPRAAPWPLVSPSVAGAR